MLTELVFSFILSTWSGVTQSYSFAANSIESFQVLDAKLSENRLLLCSLENQGLLTFDGRWRVEIDFLIPKACLNGNLQTKSFKFLKVRSTSVRLTDVMYSWDQKLEIRINSERPYVLYLRQDKKYVGLHSSQGWSAWVERKTGVFRFEQAVLEEKSHFRVYGKGTLNPVVGRIEKIRSLDALYVKMEGADVQKAVKLVGPQDGAALAQFELERGNWQKTKSRCWGVCEGSSSFLIEEEMARFGRVDSPSYKDFMRAARPLAFLTTDSRELIPFTRPYR